MVIKYNITHTIKKKTDCVIFLFCNNYKSEIKKIQKEMGIKFPISFINDFNGKKEEIKTFYLDKLAIILAGIGETNKCSLEQYDFVTSLLARNLLKHKFKNITFVSSSSDIDIVRMKIERFIMGLYKYNNYKTNKIQDTIKTVDFVINRSKNLKDIKNSIIIAENANEGRDFINAPANDCNSAWFLKEMKKNAPKSLKFKVHNKTWLKKMGMNLILSVNEGSKFPVYLVEIHYGNKKEHPIVLVGKGVMFDSGGYSIKHGDFSDMKTDMGGATMVYEVMKTLAETKAKGHYIALLPLVENMINEHATRPGDVIKSYSGKTVEIIDTDAEGRLIMADALAYSKKFKPKLVMDVATLTGSADYMLGGNGTMFMGNKHSNELIKISEKTNEKVWEMPMWRNFLDATKSDIADVKNLTLDAKAGAIMAGAFLYNFVPKGFNWIHLDIAGVAYRNKGTQYCSQGATGESLRLIYYFLINN